MTISSIVIASCLLAAVVLVSSRPTEQERVRLWHETHTWPPTWNEESPGYRALMENREREIMELTGSDERWENWMQFVQSRLPAVDSLPTSTVSFFYIV